MRQTRRHTSGFTLIELTAVMLLVGILAATAIPTVTRLRTVHEASLAQEVARRITAARAHATATGIPTGVRINLDEQRMTFLVIGQQGIEERRAGLDNLGGLRSDRLANLGNATITARSIRAQPGNPASQNADTLWFDYRGSPHLRTPAGISIGPIAQPASITIGPSTLVLVQPTTGHISVQTGGTP